MSPPSRIRVSDCRCRISRSRAPSAVTADAAASGVVAGRPRPRRAVPSAPGTAGPFMAFTPTILLVVANKSPPLLAGVGTCDQTEVRQAEAGPDEDASPLSAGDASPARSVGQYGVAPPVLSPAVPAIDERRVAARAGGQAGDGQERPNRCGAWAEVAGQIARERAPRVARSGEMVRSPSREAQRQGDRPVSFASELPGGQPRTSELLLATGSPPRWARS